MSTEQAWGIPEWTVGDRMRKALDFKGISVQAAAEYLGVSRVTVSSYLGDRVPPKLATLRLWALWTGVPLEWLQTGRSPTGPGPEGQGLPLMDSNHQPCD